MKVIRYASGTIRAFTEHMTIYRRTRDDKKTNVGVRWNVP